MYFYHETGDPKYRAHVLLRKMVRAGSFGRKTGIGFTITVNRYIWKGGKTKHGFYIK